MSAVIKVPDLINLALWSPDPSQISLDVLKTVLLIVAQQLNLDDQKVIFKGADGDKIKELIKQAPPNVATQIKVTSEEEEEKEKLTEGAISEATSFDSAGRKRRLEAVEGPLTYENGHLAKRSKFTAVTPATFARLEGKVKALQAHLELLGSSVMPSNEALIETAKTSEGKPITDLWQSMNITKRMTGAEEGIDKLASLLEIVVKEYADLKSIIEKMQDEMGEGMPETLQQIKLAADYAKKIRPREEIYGGKMPKREKVATAKPVKKSEVTMQEEPAVEGGQETVAEGEKTEIRKSKDPTEKTQEEGAKSEPVPDQTEAETTNKDNETRKSSIRKSDEQQGKASVTGSKKSGRIRVGSITDVIEPFDEEGITVERLNQFLGQHEYMRKNMEYLTAQINTLADFADEVLPEVLAGMPHMEELRQRIKELRGVDSGNSLIGEEAKYLRNKLPLRERIQDIEVRLASMSTRIKRQDALLCHKTELINERLGDADESINQMKNTLASFGNVNENLASMDRKIQEFTNRISDFQEHTDLLLEQIRKLITERDNDKCTIKTVIKEVRTLKDVKADRFEIDDVLSQKADITALNLKVPHDQFDETCRGIDEKLEYLKELVEDQVTQLNDIVDEVYKEVDDKYDRHDMAHLLQIIEEEMNKLRVRIEEVAAMKEEKLAAGVKKQLLKDVNCLSCDEKVAIAMENDGPCIPTIGEIPPYRNIRPFIVYELDNLRKMKSKNPDGKNMLDYEKLMNNDEAAKLFNTHIVNRYCGGSHTQLTPLQKVIHLEQVKPQPPDSPKADQKHQNKK